MKRLTREYETLDKVDVEIIDNNIFHWNIAINGPSGSPYFGGTFLLDFNFPNDYPFSPPKVHFMTKIYHPNIDDKGNICISILKDNWLASITVQMLADFIKELMLCPNPNDPLMPEIAKLYIENHAKYMENAREITKRYAL